MLRDCAFRKPVGNYAWGIIKGYNIHIFMCQILFCVFSGVFPSIAIISFLHRGWRRTGPACLLFRIWSQWFTTSQSTLNTSKPRSNFARFVHEHPTTPFFSFLLLLLIWRSSVWLFRLLCLQEELQGMKQRIRVVVVENEKLHSELKSKAADETLKQYTLQNSTVICRRIFFFPFLLQSV